MAANGVDFSKSRSIFLPTITLNARRRINMKKGVSKKGNCNRSDVSGVLSLLLQGTARP
jgi:hypothetical protein